MRMRWLNVHKKNQIAQPLFSLLVMLSVLFSLFVPQGVAHAALPVITVTPLTWDIIGLDSNKVTVGPNEFPVGARVCVSGVAANSVVAAFNWTSSNTYIDLSSGTQSSLALGNMAAGSCQDVYFNVTIVRNASAYTTSRGYNISAKDSLGVIARTPANRQLYVEYLISQNRNAVTSIVINGTNLPAGGTAPLFKGQTYTMTLNGFTATQGYEQLESFVVLPNNVYEVSSISTAWDKNNAPVPTDRLYADSCDWINDTTDINYASCYNATIKAGGNPISNAYTLKILDGASGATSLSGLLYDFSGSSFHYNSDFGPSARFVVAVDPADIGFTKSFAPAAIDSNGTSTLTFTIKNPAAVTLTGLKFTDVFPTNLKVANPASATTTGCGTPTFAPAANYTTLTFSGGTLAPSGTCNIKVNVTAPDGTYNNTTTNLKLLDIDGTTEIDTGKTASATLTVSSTPTPPVPSCTTPLTIANWDFQDATSPLDSTGLLTGTDAVVSQTASYSIATEQGATNKYWKGYGWEKTASTSASSPYVQFALNTADYEKIKLSLDVKANASGPDTVYLLYDDSTTFANFTQLTSFSITTSWATKSGNDFTGLTSTTGTTYFRVYGNGASFTTSGNDLWLDNVIFTGCTTKPLPGPTLTKAFSPATVKVGETSTLTFTIKNSSGTDLTNVKFSDVFPDGMQVADTPSASTTCTGATFSPVAGAGAVNVSLSSLAQGATCTAQLMVKAVKAGSLLNQTSTITTAETNPGAAASATLTVTLAPPVIEKSFGTSPILVNGTSVLTFKISNPNTEDALTGLAFTDTYPAGMVNANPANASTDCASATLTANAGAGSVSLSGGSLAKGDSCQVTVTVKGTTSGAKNNSVQITSTNGGTGNTATATLQVNAPTGAISLLKQVSTSATGPWSSNLSVAPSTPVYYQFVVENTGTTDFTSVTLTDPTVSTASCTNFANPLAVGDVVTCVVGPITGSASNGTFPNTATAAGKSGATTIATSTSTTAKYYVLPDLVITKTNDTNGNTALNVPFNWIYTAENKGQIASSFTSNQVIFSDVLPASGLTPGTVSFVSSSGVTGANNISCTVVSKTLTCTATGSVQIAAGGSLVYQLNATPTTASITLSSPANVDPSHVVTESNENNNSDSNSVYVTTVNIPRVQVTTTPTITTDTDGDGKADVNDIITYTFVVKNTGNVPLTNVNITDTQLPGLTCTTIPTLAVGASATMSCTGNTYTVTQTDITNQGGGDGDIDDTTTVTGTYSGSPVTNTDEKAVPLQPNVPAIQVTTTPTITTDTDGDGKADVNDIITYTFVVKNTGTVDLTNVNVTDDRLPNLVCTAIPTLAVGASATMTCTAGNTYTVTQTDIDNNGGGDGDIDDTTTATGYDGVTPVTDTDAKSVPVHKHSPAIQVTTTPTITTDTDGDGKADAGDIITYTFVVKNTGNVTLTNVNLTDDRLPNLVCTAIPTLAVGASATMTCTAGNTYTVTQTDIDNNGGGDGDIDDTTTATGYDGSTPVTDTDAKAVPLSAPGGGLTLTKEVAASPTGPWAKIIATGLDEGDPVYYRFTVTSTYSNALTGVTLSDPDCTLFGPVGDTDLDQKLDSSESWVFTCVATAEGGTHTNTATLDTNETSPITDSAKYVGQSLPPTPTPTPAPPGSATLIVNLFEDANNDAIRQPNESIIPHSMPIKSVDTNGVVVNTGSTTGGTYVNTAHPVGVYNIIAAGMIPGYVFTTPSEVNVTLTSGETKQVDYGFHKLPVGQKYKLSGYVWHDKDKDTKKEAGEDPIPGIEVVLFNSANVQIDSQLTDADGWFEFTNLDAGVYAAIEKDKAPFVFSTTINYKWTLIGTGSPTASADFPVSNSKAPSLQTTQPVLVFGDYVPAPGCLFGADPLVDTHAGDYPSQIKLGDPYFMMFQVGNNGNMKADNVEVLSSIPSYLQVNAVNITYLSSGTSTEGIHTTSTAGNVLDIKFDTVKPEDHYNVLVSTLVVSAPPASASPIKVDITYNAGGQPTCADLGGNNEGEFDPNTSGTTPPIDNPSAPNTGFAPGRRTVLPAQPEKEAYFRLQDIRLVIPNLNLNTPIVGVPIKNNWNATWLGNNVGWLEGTSYMGRGGNSVIVGHNYLSSGQKGPFANLSWLQVNDLIYVDEGDQRLVYKVKTENVVRPDSQIIFEAQNKDWLTLVTCKDYDEQTHQYRLRVVVRAALVEIIARPSTVGLNLNIYGVNQLQ